MSAISQSQQALLSILKQSKIAKHVEIYQEKLSSKQVKNQSFKSDSFYIAVLNLQSVQGAPDLQKVSYGIYAPSTGQQSEDKSLDRLEQAQNLLKRHEINPFVKQPIAFKQQRTFTTGSIVIWSLVFDWWIRIQAWNNPTNILKRHTTQVI